MDRHIIIDRYTYTHTLEHIKYIKSKRSISYTQKMDHSRESVVLNGGDHEQRMYMANSLLPSE